MKPPLFFRAVISVLAAFLLLAACRQAPTITQDPQQAADAFFAQVAKGNVRAAYDSTAFGFQATLSYEGFNSNVELLQLMEAQPPSWIRKEITDKASRLDCTIINGVGNTVELSVTLTPDAGKWKVFALQTPHRPRAAGPVDPFSMVGSGTGFNDVYHQPMPRADELVDLIHNTLAKFNDAIRNGDFHAFYGDISQQWKDGKRVSGETAGGVTEKILKDHFQGFTDKHIDISKVAALQPVYDRPPLINSDGLLDVLGHFDLPEFHVLFSLQYIYELPRWKLYGINVSLTK